MRRRTGHAAAAEVVAYAALWRFVVVEGVADAALVHGPDVGPELALRGNVA